MLTVVGAGSWGTALALQAARANRSTTLTGRDPQKLHVLQSDRQNKAYLPGFEFPESLRVEPDFQAAIECADQLVVSVPSHAFRSTLVMLKSLLTPRQQLCWATKGFELDTGLLPHQIAQSVLGNRPTAVLSGPTFARELAAELPTAITCASAESPFAQRFVARLSTPLFRIYTTSDVIGVEIGGAIKNVIAIAAGIADGMGLGANSRVALITRGLTEMSRLGVKLGAQTATFMGLAGLGDLVLTATDNQSRNRRFGLCIANGLTASEAQHQIGQVVEGMRAAQCVHQVSEKLNVDMPICNSVYQILYDGLSPQAALSQLMNRELKPENHE
jgi:glycerol-3-phosphate dehydrogenase (NAD(P)+)